MMRTRIATVVLTFVILFTFDKVLELERNIPGSTDITLHEPDVRRDCEVHEFGAVWSNPVLYFACSGKAFGYELQRYRKDHPDLRVTSMAPYTVWYGAQTTGYYVTFEKKN
jgi:hypothetical protein